MSLLQKRYRFGILSKEKNKKINVNTPLMYVYL